MDKSDWHRDGEVDGDDFPLIDHDGFETEIYDLYWCCCCSVGDRFGVATSTRWTIT